MRINDLQDNLKYHYKRLTGKGVNMGEFSFASLGDCKDEVLKEIKQGEF